MFFLIFEPFTINIVMIMMTMTTAAADAMTTTTFMMMMIIILVIVIIIITIKTIFTENISANTKLIRVVLYLHY